MDKLLTQADLAQAVKLLRTEHGYTTVEIANRSGRSRDILHRLEQGSDVSVSALFDILRAMGYAIALTPRGVPTLEQMRQRFAESDDESS